jgi:TM2 domain-containing membrane protein YozV
MNKWFYVEADRIMGPLTVEEMDAGAGSGLLEAETPVWREGLPGWTPIAEIAEFVNYFPAERRQDARLRMPTLLPPLPIAAAQAPVAPPPSAQPQQQFAPPPQPMAPYPVVPPPAGYIVNMPPKSKLAAGLLGIFLGAFGIHRFYLGYTTIGIVMLLITVLSIGMLSPITGLWGLIEGILCLTGSMADAQGRPLID